MTTDQLNRTEETLALALGLVVAARTGAFVREAGHPEPTPEQAAEIARVQTGAIVEIVRGLREPGPPATEGELAEVVEGLAEGAVLRVIGASPADLERAN